MRPQEPISIKWGSQVYESVLHEFVEHNWSDDLPVEVKAEADLLPAIADSAKRGDIILVKSAEVEIESWRLRGSAGRKTLMYGAPVSTVDPPMSYSREIMGWDRPSRECGEEFILSVTNPRFLEVASACGAFDGKEPKVNTLWDAFHVWTAEVAGAEFFLTFDFRMLRRTRNRGAPKLCVSVVKPSELISAIGAGAAAKSAN